MHNATRAKSLRHLAWPGHLLAWALIVFPTVGVFLAQMTPGAEGALAGVRLLGLIADSILLPLLGVFLGAFLAEYLEQGGFRRFYALLSGVLALGLLVAVPVFALDILQVRTGVQPIMRRLFDLNSLRSLLMLVIAAAMLVVLAVVVWRALGRGGRVAEDEARVVWQPATTSQPR